jgi:hypothetical protein
MRSDSGSIAKDDHSAEQSVPARDDTITQLHTLRHDIVNVWSYLETAASI